VRFIDEKDDSKSGYKKGSGTLFYHRMGCYAHAYREIVLNKKSPDQLGKREPTHIEVNEAYDILGYTNMIKCSPTINLGKPSKNMYRLCGNHIHRHELDVLSPRCLVVFGRQNSRTYQERMFGGDICSICGPNTPNDRDRVELYVCKVKMKKTILISLPHPSSRGSLLKPYLSLAGLLDMHRDKIMAL